MKIQDLLSNCRVTGEGFRADCPKCGETDRSLSFNLEKEVGCCWHSHCDWFVERGGVTFRILRLHLARGAEVSLGLELREEFPEGPVQLPENFVYVERVFPLELRSSILGYLESRGLTRKALRKAEVGYCERGKLWGYLIFPVFEQGELVYWQARRFKKREPKFRNPMNTKKSELLYCPDTTPKPNAVIVESIINALTLFGVSNWMPIATFGKMITEQQIMKVRRFPAIKHVVIALDPDARREALDTAKRMIGLFRSVRVTENAAADVNSLGAKRAWKLVQNSRLYTPDQHMRMLYG